MIENFELSGHDLSLPQSAGYDHSTIHIILLLLMVSVWSGRLYSNKLLRWQVLQALDQLGSPQPKSMSATVAVVSTHA